MNGKENFLKKKTFREKNGFVEKNKENSIVSSSDKSSLLEILYRKAKIIYDDKSAVFDLDRPENQKNKDNKWTAEIIKSGTLEDKISAIALYIKKNPLYCLKYVEMLIKMAKKKNRRQTESCVMTLKDLFLDDILSNKKLSTFYFSINRMKLENNNEIPKLSDEKLIEIYIEDFIHKKYSELIEIIEDIIINDPIKALKKKYLNILLQMISKRPEKEEKILDVLINKLGDPDVEISNHTIKVLKDLQTAHPKMSLILLKNVQNFISKLDNKNHEGRYYSLVYLTQMNVINDKEFLEYSLDYFFDLFNVYVTEAEENHKVNKGKLQKKKKLKENKLSENKFLSLILKRINMICKFASERKIPINKYLDEKINTLFKLSHSDSIKLRIEVLKLIFIICQGVVLGANNRNYNKNSQNITNNISFDRYYKSLYEILLIKEIICSKYVRELLKLIMMSLSFDSNLPRIAAFLKRLLQVSLLAEPAFITCVLIIVSQILRNKHKLWKMIEKNNADQIQQYDFIKRDPIYTTADSFPIAEIAILRSHYHPSVQKFSQFILDNYNKEIISYEGDPLVDFSLINFLEKFILKNAKIKKDKQKNKGKVNNEEEELQKFLGEEVENKEINKNNKNNNQLNSSSTKQDEIDFIKKFNEMEKVNSVKYERNQYKKNKNKMLSNNEDDVEKIADGIIEKEYEKYDKDIDNDEDFSDFDDHINRNEEEEEFENEDEDENEDDYPEDYEEEDLDK